MDDEIVDRSEWRQDVRPPGPSQACEALEHFAAERGLKSSTIEVGMMTGVSGTNYLTSVAVMVEHNSPEPAPLTETSARVITVNYTGNGTGQTIDFGVDMLPTALLVMPATGASSVEPLIWWESRQGAGSLSESTL